MRKKTAAAIAGISIGALCLWGVALWQDISLQELASILLGTLLMLATIIVAALLLIILVKGFGKILKLMAPEDPDG